MFLKLNQAAAISAEVNWRFAFYIDKGDAVGVSFVVKGVFMDNPHSHSLMQQLKRRVYLSLCCIALMACLRSIAAEGLLPLS
jgi:hypothetical protein